MRLRRFARTTALVLAVFAFLSLCAIAARAAGAMVDPVATRDHISRNIAAALAHEDSAHAGLALPPAADSGTAGVRHATARRDVAVARPAADPGPEGTWADLVAGTQRFVADRPRARAFGRERIELAGAQHPRAIVLGCSDSRVSPELVFDQTLGDLFVVRTAGNIVDPIALGSIEYAADHLHARLLVVLGHSSCGAVRAAAGSDDMPSASLQAIVDRIRPVVQRLEPCFEGEELIDRSIVANARQSAQDVLAGSALLREEVAKGELKVVSAVYDLRTGAVTPVSLPLATAQARVPAR